MYAATCNYGEYGLWEGPEPNDFNPDLGPWRVQLTIADDPDMGALDIFGMPLMAGKVAVLDPRALETLENYFMAAIYEPNDPCIPAVDFEVKVRFTNYLYKDPENTIKPVLGYNPAIENITMRHNGQSSVGNWLLDTGATSSIISGEQGYALGLTEPNGRPILPPDFELPIGGVGGDANAPGYIVDSLEIQTLQGFKLIYDHAHVLVLNIEYIDPYTDEFVYLDGVFGTNFMAASATLDLVIVGGAYNFLVFDTVRSTLGFDLKDEFPMPAIQPACGDPNHPFLAGDMNFDCLVNSNDLESLLYEWNRSDCGWLTWYCAGADINQDQYVNLQDISIFSENYLANTHPSP
jgi:hypothetical protein